MSMKKRILSALLALCLTGSLAGTALAAVSATPTPAPAGALPQTGDSLPLGLLVGLAVAAAAAVVVLVVLRRRKK